MNLGFIHQNEKVFKFSKISIAYGKKKNPIFDKKEFYSKSYKKKEKVLTGQHMRKGKIMTLLEEWRNEAYSEKMSEKDSTALWTHYFQIEKGIYEQILAEPDLVVEGTVKELAEKYQCELKIMVGFLDGINDSLVTPNPIEEMTEDTKVSLCYDKEKLYYNMVGAKAEWLYKLPQWDNLLSEEKRKELYKAQKSSTTIVKGRKIYPNDPCPCGSGKKYKKCCGRNA